MLPTVGVPETMPGSTNGGSVGGVVGGVVGGIVGGGWVPGGKKATLSSVQTPPRPPQPTRRKVISGRRWSSTIVRVNMRERF